MLKKIIVKVLKQILIFVVVILVLNIENKDEKITDFEKVETTSAVVNIPDKLKNLLEIKQTNSDVVAWIHIPGTNIDWPVMKWVTTDADIESNTYKKSFYDRKDEYKNYAFEGSIYSGEGVVFAPFKKLSNNLVIHGHNLDDNPNGKKFAQLVKFQDIEFAKRTPYIFITTEDELLIYQIYAVFFMDLNFECYWIGLDEERQLKMIEEARARSEYIYDIDVTGKDKIITLSTCTYKYGKYQSVGQKNTRFVIQGKLLDKNAKLDPSALLIKNKNPKEPKFN